MFKTDYWNRYKHYFIHRLAPFSFNTFDEFYNCAYEILEQQELMKNLQKNFFYNTQQTVIQLEQNAILRAFESCNQNQVDIDEVADELKIAFSSEVNVEQKQVLENMIKLVTSSNQNKNYDYFWNLYNKDKQDIIMAINNNALTKYIPMQIRISIDNALKKFNSIPAIGCEGYSKLKKISKRKM